MGGGLIASGLISVPRATSLFGLVLERAGICKTFVAFVVWSQDWGLCLKAPLKVLARFSAHSAQVRKNAVFATHLSRVC